MRSIIAYRTPISYRILLQVEATLRRLVGSSEDTDQCELIYQIMSYIKELQQQLNEDEVSILSAFLSFFVVTRLELGAEHQNINSIDRNVAFSLLSFTFGRFGFVNSLSVQLCFTATKKTQAFKRIQ